MSGQKRTATAYLQLANRSPRGGAYWANDATVVKVTNSAPDRVEPGCIVVKVRITVPRDSWTPEMPAVVVDVPADLIAPVEAEAVEP